MLKRDSVSNLVLTEEVDKGVVLARVEPLTKTIVRSFQKAGLKKVVVIDTTVDDGAIIRCLKKDPTQNEEEALKDIYKRSALASRLQLRTLKRFKRLFQDPRRYDLVESVAVAKPKLKMDTDLEFRVVGAEDVVEATKHSLA